MSRRQEFEQGHQLPMFMSPQELIDTTDKADSRYRIDNPEATPREQWELGRGYETSLRDEKLSELGDYAGESFDKAPPVALFHGGSSGRMRLADGHHRLAHAENTGMQFIAVEHHFPKSWL